jgi:hypothetical protein
MIEELKVNFSFVICYSYSFQAECISILSKGLTKENVLQRFVLAYLHNCEELKGRHWKLAILLQKIFLLFFFFLTEK